MPSDAQHSESTSPLQAYSAFLGNRGDAAPIGVRGIEPRPETRQAERGNLYAVVELMGDHPERQQVTEQLLGVIQRIYYTARGKQSTILTESVRQALAVLGQFNQQNPQTRLQGNILCAGLLNNRLMITGVGQVFALVHVQQRIEMFPPSQPLFALPDSEQSNLDILRWGLGDGDAFFLGSADWERTVSLRTLAATVAYVDAESRFDAVSGLMEGSQMLPPPGLLVVAAAKRTEGQGASAAPLLRRSGAGSLPTAVRATAPAGQAATTPRAGETQGDSVSVTKIARASRVDASRSMDKGVTGAPPLPSQSQAAASTAKPAPTSLVTFLRSIGASFANIFPDRPQPGRSAAAGVQNTTPTANARMAAEQTVQTPPSLEARRPNAPIVEPFTPPAPASGSRARLFVLIALLIALLVPAIVAGVIWRNGAENRAQAESLLELANTRILSAQTAIDINDKDTALQALTEARNALDSREAMLAGPDPNGDELHKQIERLSQQVLQVQPLYGLVYPLVQFPAEAKPRRLLINAQDIFVLDEARQLVEQYRLDATLETVPDPTGEVVIKQGDTIDGVQAGAPLDFTWQPPVPGIEDKSNLLVLDNNNHVFRYNPKLEGVGALPLGGDETLKSVQQIKAYSGRLYLADVAANQIYRYQAGQYDADPEAWFAPQTQADLTGLRTFRIDGSIWLMFNNSQILRFFSGEQTSFALDASIGALQEPSDLAVSDQESGFIYLADRAGERVVVFRKDGTYVSQLKATEGNPLKNLNAIYVEDDTGSLYLLTDSALYKHALPR